MMTKTILTALLCCLLTSGWSQNKKATVKVIQLENLLEILNQKSDTVYVVNFWATWCQPCVKELPAFEKVTSTYSSQKLKVILVSMDFKSKLTSRVIPFAEKQNLQSQVVLLNEPDYNSWINKVSSNWTGAIPATVFIKGSTGTRIFHEKGFEFEELKSIIEPLLTQK